MRLFVLTLAASAFAQPALAHEHARPHHRTEAWHEAARHAPRHGSGTVHARRHVVRFAARRQPWVTLHARQAAPITTAVADVRLRAFDDRQSAYRRYPDRYGAPGGTAPPSADRVARRDDDHGGLDAMIARHAQLNGVPEALVRRVVMRESRYNPRAVNHGALGLMQIKYATARAMGYAGSPAGLFDPETNLTYAVRYLAGAYRVAGGNPDRAVANYARGYYYAAKRQGLSPYADRADRGTGSDASAQPVQQVVWSGPAPRRYSAGGRLRRSY